MRARFEAIVDGEVALAAEVHQQAHQVGGKGVGVLLGGAGGGGAENEGGEQEGEGQRAGHGGLLRGRAGNEPLLYTVSHEIPSNATTKRRAGAGHTLQHHSETCRVYPDTLRERVEQSFEEIYEDIDRAYHGDRYARARLLTMELVPEEIKQPIKLAGGEVPGC